MFNPHRRALPLLLAILAGCGEKTTEPIVSLPATFDGNMKLFEADPEPDETAHQCTASASFTLAGDGSGSFHVQRPSFVVYGRVCERWYPASGTLTGSWVARDTLEFRTVKECGREPCNRVFHENEGDVWRAYVSADTMRFVGFEPDGIYRFEFGGVRQ